MHTSPDGPARPADGAVRHDDEQAVFALDNIAVELPVAGVVTRLVAGSVDYALVALVGFAWIFGGIFLVGAFQSMWVVAVILLGLFLIEYGYFAGCEIALGGRTPGKILTGLRVVMSHGGQPTRAALLVRNAVRTIDVMVGPALMAIDPLARRLGDRLGDTLVVHLPTARDGALLVAQRLPRGWGSAEAALVESFFRRLPELDAARAEAMARRLLAAVEKADPGLVAGVPAHLPPAERLRAALEVGGEPTPAP